MDTSLVGYDYVSSVPAVQIPVYQTVVPTLEDSSAAGIPWFDFIVVAHTTVPSQYYVTAPSRGYSVDNLAPVPPSGLSGIAQPGAHVQLTWNAPTDPDVGSYDIYRSPVDGFVPSISSKIANVRSVGYTDGGLSAGTYYYRIVAIDVHDNRSQASDQAAVTLSVTSVDDNAHGPAVFALMQNYPNPFNPTTLIQYSLPSREWVRLAVYNMLGQEVAAPVDGIRDAGSNSVTFDASHLPSGIYTYRLTTANATSSKMMILIR
jgi:hypothetical protein